MDELHNLTEDAKKILNEHIQKRLHNEYTTGFFHGLAAGAIIVFISLTVGVQVR